MGGRAAGTPNRDTLLKMLDGFDPELQSYFDRVLTALQAARTVKGGTGNLATQLMEIVNSELDFATQQDAIGVILDDFNEKLGPRKVLPPGAATAAPAAAAAPAALQAKPVAPTAGLGATEAQAVEKLMETQLGDVLGLGPSPGAAPAQAAAVPPKPLELAPPDAPLGAPPEVVAELEARKKEQIAALKKGPKQVKLRTGGVGTTEEQRKLSKAERKRLAQEAKIKLRAPDDVRIHMPGPAPEKPLSAFDPVRLVDEAPDPKAILAKQAVEAAAAAPPPKTLKSQLKGLLKPKGMANRLLKGTGALATGLWGADLLAGFIGSFGDTGPAAPTPEQMQAKVRQNMALQQSVDIMAQKRPEVYQAVLNLLGGVPPVGTDLSEGDVLFGGPADNAGPSDVSPEQMAAFFGNLMG